MPCCCDVPPTLPNCVNQGPCRTCSSCEGLAYPANWRVNPTVGCLGNAYILQGVVPSTFNTLQCYCAYGCEIAPDPDRAGAGLLIFTFPNGIRRAWLNIYDYRPVIDLDISYYSLNWNCCGTNVMILGEGEMCGSQQPPATRTLTPVGPCVCTDPALWCSRRPPTLNCLVRNMVDSWSVFNNTVIPCPWQLNAPFTSGWKGEANFFEDPDNITIEVFLSCHSTAVGIAPKWIASGHCTRNGGTIASGNDSGNITTSVCNPVMHESGIFVLGSPPPVSEPNQIRTTWMEP